MAIKDLEPIDLRIALIFATVLLLVIVLSKVPPDHYRPGEPSGPEWRYDTSEDCDKYIKDELTTRQLTIFNRVLCVEERQDGRELSNEQILRIVSERELDTIRAAYERWLECKNLNRNKDHVVYPRDCR